MAENENILDGLTEEQLALAEPLTHLQVLTVIGHVGGKSGRQAYYDAGGKARTDKAADAIVSRMLADARVKAFRQSLVGSIAKASIMTREEAMERLSAVGRTKLSDIAEFAEIEIEGGSGRKRKQTVWRIKSSNEIPPGAMAAIKSVTATRNGPKLELHDSLAAIKQLGEMQGWEAPKRSQVEFPNGITHKYSPEDYKRAAEDIRDHFPD